MGKVFFCLRVWGILELSQILVAKVLVSRLTRCKKDGDDIEEWGKTLFSVMPWFKVRKSFLMMVLFKTSMGF